MPSELCALVVHWMTRNIKRTVVSVALRKRKRFGGSAIANSSASAEVNLILDRLMLFTKPSPTAIKAKLISYITNSLVRPMSNTNGSLILKEQAELAATPFLFSENDLTKIDKTKPKFHCTGERLFRDRPHVYKAVVKLLAEPGVSVRTI